MIGIRVSASHAFHDVGPVGKRELTTSRPDAVGSASAVTGGTMRLFGTWDPGPSHCLQKGTTLIRWRAELYREWQEWLVREATQGDPRSRTATYMTIMGGISKQRRTSRDHPENVVCSKNHPTSMFQFFSGPFSTMQLPASRTFFF